MTVRPAQSQTILTSTRRFSPSLNRARIDYSSANLEVQPKPGEVLFLLPWSIICASDAGLICFVFGYASAETSVAFNSLSLVCKISVK